MERLYYFEDRFYTMKAKRLTNKQFAAMKAKKNLVALQQPDGKEHYITKAVEQRILNHFNAGEYKQD